MNCHFCNKYIEWISIFEERHAENNIIYCDKECLEQWYDEKYNNGERTGNEERKPIIIFYS